MTEGMVKNQGISLEFAFGYQLWDAAKICGLNLSYLIAVKNLGGVEVRKLVLLQDLLNAALEAVDGTTGRARISRIGLGYDEAFVFHLDQARYGSTVRFPLIRKIRKVRL